MLSDPDAYNVTKIEAAHAAAKKLVTAWVNAVNDPEMADLQRRFLKTQTSIFTTELHSTAIL